MLRPEHWLQPRNRSRELLVLIVALYESANASRISAETSSQEARAQRLSEAGTLMASKKQGVRLAGVEVLGQLLNDKQITQQRAYGILTAYMRSESPWVGAPSRKRWNAMKGPARTAARSSATFGRDSLRKRSPDVQGAHFDAPVNEDGTPRPEQPTVLTNADLRQASFAGATMPGARLTGAVMDRTDFSHAILAGAHLEGADLRRTVGLATVDLTGIVADAATQWPAGVVHP
jgi:hypothetical protein